MDIIFGIAVITISIAASAAVLDLMLPNSKTSAETESIELNLNRFYYDIR